MPGLVWTFLSNFFRFASNVYVYVLFDCSFLHQKSKKRLAPVIEGDQKAPFSIATTPRCRGGRYSFPWIAPLYPRYVPYIAEC